MEGRIANLEGRMIRWEQAIRDHLDFHTTNDGLVTETAKKMKAVRIWVSHGSVLASATLALSLCCFVLSANQALIHLILSIIFETAADEDLPYASLDIVTLVISCVLCAICAIMLSQDILPQFFCSGMLGHDTASCCGWRWNCCAQKGLRCCKDDGLDLEATRHLRNYPFLLFFASLASIGLLSTAIVDTIHMRDDYNACLFSSTNRTCLVGGDLMSIHLTLVAITVALGWTGFAGTLGIIILTARRLSGAKKSAYQLDELHEQYHNRHTVPPADPNQL